MLCDCDRQFIIHHMIVKLKCPHAPFFSLNKKRKKIDSLFIQATRSILQHFISSFLSVLSPFGLYSHSYHRVHSHVPGNINT